MKTLEFKAMVLDDFRIKWLENAVSEKEGTIEEVTQWYGIGLTKLCDRIVGATCTFVRDTGYADKETNKKYCFEVLDMDYVIPIKLLITETQQNCDHDWEDMGDYQQCTYSDCQLIK